MTLWEPVLSPPHIDSHLVRFQRRAGSSHIKARDGDSPGGLKGKARAGHAHVHTHTHAHTSAHVHKCTHTHTHSGVPAGLCQPVHRLQNHTGLSKSLFNTDVLSFLPRARAGGRDTTNGSEEVTSPAGCGMSALQIHSGSRVSEE